MAFVSRVVAGTLWGALGRPALGGLLPSGKSTEWAVARAALDETLCDWGAGWKPSSPAALWQALNGTACPRGGDMGWPY